MKTINTYKYKQARFDAVLLTSSAFRGLIYLDIACNQTSATEKTPLLPFLSSFDLNIDTNNIDNNNNNNDNDNSTNKEVVNSTNSNSNLNQSARPIESPIEDFTCASLQNPISRGDVLNYLISAARFQVIINK